MTARRVHLRRPLAAVGIWLGLGLAGAACGHSQPTTGPSATGPSTAGPSTTLAPVTTPRPTTPPTTTPPTTVWKAPAPQTSPDAAASKLVNAWAGGDRVAAMSVAAPEAVATLFAAPYPGAGLAIPRGCSTAFLPVKCTYGPPGGASPNDAIYEITVSQTPAGWYVSSVQVLA